jgi:DNA helicase-2/ATP-dependent DNA helicase PcrA
VIAYLKLAMNPFDDIALLRVINTPVRGIGKTSIDALQAAAKSNGASLWMTIRGVTDPEFPLDVAMTTRGREALRGFKTVIEGLIKKRPTTAAITLSPML